MSEGAISIKKAVPIIVVTWILSLVTTLALVYVAPSIFPPLNTANIGDEAIVADKIADGAIIVTKLADGTVSSAKILDGTITATDLDDGSVVTLKIADGAVTTAKIVDGAVTSAKVADSAIVTVKLANDSVTSEKIADGNVTTSDLANSAVTTSKIADDAIVTVKLADGSVTSAKILDGTITALDLATATVTTIKIADGAVTTSKIADYAVTDIKLASRAIPFNSTYAGPGDASTTSTTWEDMPNMAVNITLTRASHVLIMFSAEARLDAAGNFLMVRAYAGTLQAYPDTGNLFITRETLSEQSAHTFIFYRPSVSAGTYIVKMQWRLISAGTGTVGDRTLTVIALPA